MSGKLIKNDSDITPYGFSEKTLFIERGLFAQWLPRGLQHVKDSLGLSMPGSPIVNKLTITATERSVNLGFTSQKSTIEKTTASTTLNSSVSLNDVNGKGTSTYLNAERQVASFLTNAVMGANIVNYSSLPGFIKAGAAALVTGYDDIPSSTITDLGYGYAPADYNGDSAGYGYIWFRYLAHNSKSWKKSATATIRDLMSVLAANETASGYDLLDEAVNKATNGYFKSSAAVQNAIRYDYNRLYVYHNPQKFLQQACGINLNNADIGAITGQDAGGGGVKTADSLIKEAPLAALWAGPQGDTTSIGNMTVSWASSDYTGWSYEGIVSGTPYSNDTLKAGTGSTSLWGGGSTSDLLEGDTASKSEYFFFEGDGKDTIRGANWGSGGDKLCLDIKPGFSYTKDGNDVTIKIGKSGSDQLVLEDVGEQVVDVTTNTKNLYHVKFGQADGEVTFASSVNYYLGKSGSTLKIADSGARVWLDNKHGKHYSGFSRLDGSGAEGTLLIAGNGKKDEVILGGASQCSLWGGGGTSSDTLTGGSGQNSFFYLKNNGNDVITEADANDKVVLYNAKLGDISRINFQDGGVALSMKAGGTLTINSVDDSTTFVLKGGAAYQHSGGKWHKA